MTMITSDNLHSPNFYPTTGSVGLGSFAFSLVSFWALSHQPSCNQTLKTLVIQLLLKIIGRISGHSLLQRTRASWKNPRECQEQLLQEIIKQNNDTEYGRKHDVKEIKSLEQFRKCHPLTTYEHYGSYIERMMRGEENVLTRRNPTTFIRTTGTTGKSKYIPFTSKKDIFQTVVNITNEAIYQNFPSIGPLQKRVYFYVHPSVTMAANGGKIETLTTLPVDLEFLFCEFTTPAIGYKIMTTYESTYIHFLFGLRERDVGAFNIGFLPNLESAMQQLKRCWKDIVKDLEHGTINASLNLPEDIRTRLTMALGKGDLDRARQLRQEFEKGFTGIMKRIWPRLQVIASIDQTGVWPRVESTFAKGKSLSMLSMSLFPCQLTKNFNTESNITNEFVLHYGPLDTGN